MEVRRLSLAGLGLAAARACLGRALSATPADAVVQLRIDGPVASEVEPLLAAASLRALAGDRNVSIAAAASSPRVVSRSRHARQPSARPGVISSGLPARRTS
jgi:hypothetical protein